MTSAFVEPTPLQPYFSTVYVPDLRSLHLSQDEQDTITRLQMRAWRDRSWMLLTDSYYRGMQIIHNLGISIPPELDGLRILVGWPKIAVDPYVERLATDSFRIANATTADETLTDLYVHNGMAGEQSISFLESLVNGRCYYTVGSGADPGDAPRICVESPLNMSVGWDSWTRKPKEALQTFWMDGRRHAALWLLDQTISVAEGDDGAWEIIDRDQHNFGVLPIIRQSNRARAADRDGSSEITPELMSIVDSACRTMLNLSVAGEFYSVPQKLLLGASESDFIGSDGQQKSAWQTYISAILALDRDEQGELPQVEQFKAYDPSVFTKVVEMWASQAAGIMAAPPQDLGLYTQGNPVSADAAQVSESRRDRRALRMQADFGPAQVETAQMAMRFLNGGDLPKEYEQLSVDWCSPQMPNFTGMADGMAKLMGEGAVPHGSDVALKRLGFSAVERRQMAEERKTDTAAEIVTEVGQSVEGKAVRAVNALANAASTAVVPESAAPAPQQLPNA